MRPTPSIRTLFGPCSFVLALFVASLAGCDAAPTGQETPEPSGESAALDAKTLLDRTIAFHDPSGTWPSAAFGLALEESRPDGTVRHTKLQFDNSQGLFEIETQREGEPARAVVVGETVQEFEGAWEEDRVLWMRNYYLFLYGLPMKFKDPGTQLDERVGSEIFRDKDVLSLRLTYDPEVGKDIWYVLLDPGTYEMVGYRFYHDENVGDGETVFLDELAEVAGMHLPKSRTWYTNKDNELLGTDTIVFE